MTSDPKPPRQVRCPRCGTPSELSTENPFRPFCSERCRLLDLGAWAEESYKIPVQKVEDLEEDPEESDAEA